MTNPTVLGLVLGVGLVLFGTSFLPRTAPTAPSPDARPLLARLHLAGRLPTLAPLAIGLAVAVALWAELRIPVLSLAALTGGAVPILVRRRPPDLDVRDLGETASTVARWIEGVRDYLLTSSTLQDALVRACGDVRGPHAPAFARFAAALSGSGGYGVAAQDLADELGNTLADKALTALWIGGREGGDIQTALGLLAESAQVEADNAHRIEAGLAGVRRLVRIVLGLCTAILVCAVFAFRENFTVYRSVGGQLVLAVGLAVMAGSWWGIWRLSKIEAPERLVSVRPVGGGGRPW